MPMNIAAIHPRADAILPTPRSRILQAPHMRGADIALFAVIAAAALLAIALRLPDPAGACDALAGIAGL